MRLNNGVGYDYLVHGDRRKAERRRQPLDRRGVLRWDPRMRERRDGGDRRHVGAMPREQ